MSVKGKLHIYAAAACFAFFTPVFAATVAEEAQGLINQGQHAEALKRLDAHLSKNPQDAEARFTRGLALVKLARNDDAIKTFSELTRDYPQLPEPYNNLAVLYAQQGDYEKARDALEAALATHPSYATAHENLGDIYAALAGAAYNRALMLDQGNAGVRNKLNLISQLDRVPTDTVVASAPKAPKPAAPAPAPVAPVAVTPATPSPAEPAAVPAGGTSEAILGALLSWSNAWSAQDINSYLATYSDEFSPEGGLTRRAWESQRRDRISRPRRIKITALNPDVTLIGADRARVSFLQDYESDSFSDRVNKVLEFKLSGGAWKITREYSR